MHIFCMAKAEVLSSHMQVMHMPLAIFSIFIMQRGAMAMADIMLVLPGIIMPIGMLMGMFGIIEGVMPIMLMRSAVIVLIGNSCGKVMVGTAAATDIGTAVRSK